MADEALNHRRTLPGHNPTYLPWLSFRPAVNDPNTPITDYRIFTPPLTSPLLVNNSTSEVRDLLATERTFLSNIRLAVYLAVVAAAIFVQFHLKDDPTPTERAAAKPIGAIFAVLSFVCMGMGVGNYAETVEGYARKRALVQSGVKTQVILGVLGAVVVGTCLFFIGIEGEEGGRG